MANYGSQPTGFTRPSFSEVRNSIIADLRSQFGDINTSPEGVFGQLIGILSEREFLLWEALEGVYTASNPYTGVGEQLDALAAITGLNRSYGLRAFVDLNLTGDPGTLIPAGSAVQANNGSIFLTVSDVTIEPNGEAVVESSAEEVGEQFITPHSIVTIVDQVQGWDTVDNENAQTSPGANRETDADMRDKIISPRPNKGRATVNAMQDRIKIEAEDVLSVTVYENLSETKHDGVESRAIDVVVYGGVDEDVAEAVWRNKPAGIRTETDYSSMVSIVDDDGFPREVHFTRPLDVNIWVDVEITKSSGPLPSDLGNSVKDAIVDLGRELGVGQDVILHALYCAVLNIRNVVDANITIAGPVDVNNNPLVPDTLKHENVEIKPRWVSKWDPANIDVGINIS